MSRSTVALSAKIGKSCLQTARISFILPKASRKGVSPDRFVPLKLKHFYIQNNVFNIKNSYSYIIKRDFFKATIQRTAL